MAFADFYFQKFNSNERKIKAPASKDLSLIITIPSFNEKNIIKALESLYFCEPTQGLTEVIVIFNYPSDLSEQFALQHEQQYREVHDWIANHQKEKLRFYSILEVLPAKDAGVGLARKIAMDEAVRRFNDLDKARGIIAGFDADCTCSKNYLKSIENAFLNHRINGCSVYFEHPLQGDDEPETHEVIVFYELYLRYYIEALRFASFPYAFHTLGSSFAVSAEAYVKQGGMNKRKAGEDFYFLHKIIPMGNFVELNDCAVYPSSRVSDRVPFGTGAAVKKILQLSNYDYDTFCPKSFHTLRKFFEMVPEFFEEEVKVVLDELDASILDFLLENGFEEELLRIKKRCTSQKTFVKAFYQWFNGLMVLQYLNQSHESYFKKIPVSEATRMMLKEMYNVDGNKEPAKLLQELRMIQKSGKLNYLPL